ncbi:MAG: hypothetical protein C0467_16405 [Planctomycetaceae bacterium]|nr:hypothetical protein [Planctomycetaceae bacterium]
MASLTEVWPLLLAVRSLRFDARSEAATGWNGIGIGVVTTSEPTAGVVVFEETGTWQPSDLDRPAIRFNNVFRWTVVGNSLRLEHLRFGPDNPVMLFDMAPDPNGDWREVSPHQCREDCYTASLTVEGHLLVVTWSIQGPRKRESIRYTYSQLKPTRSVARDPGRAGGGISPLFCL